MPTNNPEKVINSLEDKRRGLEYELSNQKDALESLQLLVKELDAAWNGDATAENPDLCDLVTQIRQERTLQKSQIRALLNLLRAVGSLGWLIPELEKFGWDGMQDEKATFEEVNKVINDPGYAIAGSIEHEINALTKDRDEFKRLYDFRGMVIKAPCIHCGKVPNRIKLAGK